MTAVLINNHQAAQDALTYIEPDLEYSNWRDILFALVSEFGREEGGAMFDSWSLLGRKYNSQTVRTMIRNADPNGGIKIGTLFHIAKRYGYRPEAPTAPRVIDPEEEKCRAEAAKREAEELLQILRDTTMKAKEIWNAARPASPDHPYIRHKQVNVTPTLREIPLADLQSLLGYLPKSSGNVLSGDTVLVAPIAQNRDGKREISNVELIDASGSKAALAGRGTKTGGYWSVAKLPEGEGEGVTILIAEGVATALSAQHVTGYPTVASLSAGNMPAVAKSMSELYPKASLVVLADIGNGQADAEKTAQIVGCRIAVPVIPEGARGKDFNDMAIASGLEAVSDAINGATSSHGAWTEPEPLDESLPPVPAFDYSMLPEKVREYVRDSAERMQCPPDYVAVSMMAALGSVIGRRVGVRPKREDNWTEYANLWGMLIGRPSMKKSPAMNAGFAGLYKLEKKAAENYAKDIEQHQQNMVIAEMRNKQIKHNIAAALKKDLYAAVDARLDEPAEPVLVRYTSNNFSPEAVVEVLRYNPNGLLCWEDELIGLLKRWSKDGQEDSRGLFLQNWSGKMPYTTDRIGRGMNLHVTAVCLSVFGTTQPGVIADFVRAAVKGGTGDDGLIQRFRLMVYPDKSDESEIRFIDERPNLQAQREMEALFDHIVEGTPEDFGTEQGEHDPTPYLRLDDQAYVLFKEWNVQNERRMRSGDLHPAMESHLSKYNKLVLGLALICHLANGSKGVITEVAMLQALSWVEYLEPHAHRVFFAINNAKAEAAKSLLRKIRKGELVDSFTVRDIYRKGWVYLSTLEDAQQAIDLLVGHGYLVADRVPASGRPTVRYLVNPRGSS